MHGDSSVNNFIFGLLGGNQGLVEISLLLLGWEEENKPKDASRRICRKEETLSLGVVRPEGEGLHSI